MTSNQQAICSHYATIKMPAFSPPNLLNSRQDAKTQGRKEDNRAFVPWRLGVRE
jgi:hypothetical protein